MIWWFFLYKLFRIWSSQTIYFTERIVHIKVDSERSVPHEQMLQLASQFPKFPFPQPWLRQFWITAFKCHIEGESANGEQFSKWGKIDFLKNFANVNSGPEKMNLEIGIPTKVEHFKSSGMDIHKDEHEGDCSSPK